LITLELLTLITEFDEFQGAAGVLVTFIILCDIPWSI
jgi:hypothetical protein